MNVLAIVKYTFFTVGAALLVGSAALVAHTRGFIANAQRAEGTVIDVLANRSTSSSSGTSVTYSPVFEFRTADGRLVEVRSSTSSNPPSHTEGDKVPVLYLPASPEDARIASYFPLWGGATITGGLGAVFFLVGAVMIVLPLRAQKRARYLMAHGTPLQAEVREVALNRAFQVNGRHPWRIVAQWKDPVTADFHVFRSANLWGDPSAHMPGAFVTVFIDGQNPRRYHMDTSFLPKAP